MPVIKLETEIKAPIERCFDLSRSIELHQLSTAQTGEKAIAGKITGLLGPGEQVTWQARHFGIRQQLTSRITEYHYPDYFCDEMVQGAFRRFRHEHHFTAFGETTTLMLDIFDFTSPFGWAGSLFNALVLTRYMRNLLTERNQVIKSVAEGNNWQKILPESQ